MWDWVQIVGITGVWDRVSFAPPRKWDRIHFVCGTESISLHRGNSDEGGERVGRVSFGTARQHHVTSRSGLA